MTLDLLTLQAVLLATHILSTLIIVMNWRINPDVPGAKEWAIGRFLVSSAVIFFALRAFLPPMLVISVGNVLVFSGYYVVYTGIRRYMERPSLPHWPFLAAIVVASSVHFYFVYVRESSSLVVALFTIAFSFLSFLALMSRKEVGFTSARFLGLTLAFYGLFYVWVAAYNVIVLPEVSLGQDTPMSRATFFFSILFSALTALFYVSMTAEHLNAGLKRQADIDPLTGAFNRRAFRTVAGQIWAAHTRAQDSLAILVLDLDHFKQINDRWGHATGDGVLCQTVQIINKAIREQDLLARFGGEEFVVLCPATDVTGAAHLAERIRTHIESAPYKNIGHEDIAATVSIGVAVSNDLQSETIDQLIDDADLAVYEAKERGRNCVAVHQTT